LLSLSSCLFIPCAIFLGQFFLRIFFYRFINPSLWMWYWGSQHFTQAHRLQCVLLLWTFVLRSPFPRFQV
jgi:hypothetical protein